MSGVDICSENTYFAEDFEDLDIFDDTQTGNLDNEVQQTQYQNNDAYFDFSSDEDGEKGGNMKVCKEENFLRLRSN